MAFFENKIIFFLSKILRFADKVIGTTGNKRASLLDALPDIGDLHHLEGAIDLYGKPFYFDLINFRYSWLVWLVDKNVTRDCYLFGNIKDESPVVLDVGAHIGTFTRHVLGKKPNATVYAFEPDMESFSILNKNLSYFENGIALQKGVLGRKETLGFYKSPNGFGWRAMPSVGEQFYETKKNEGDQFAFKCKVELIDIDSFCKENSITQLDLLKIHVPGKIEFDILKGAEETINKFHPQICISIFPQNLQKILEFMSSKRYEEISIPVNNTQNLKIFTFKK